MQHHAEPPEVGAAARAGTHASPQSAQASGTTGILRVSWRIGRIGDKLDAATNNISSPEFWSYRTHSHPPADIHAELCVICNLFLIIYLFFMFSSSIINISETPKPLANIKDTYIVFILIWEIYKK